MIDAGRYLGFFFFFSIIDSKLNFCDNGVYFVNGDNLMCWTCFILRGTEIEPLKFGVAKFYSSSLFEESILSSLFYYLYRPIPL